MNPFVRRVIEEDGFERDVVEYLKHRLRRVGEKVGEDGFRVGQVEVRDFEGFRVDYPGREGLKYRVSLGEFETTTTTTTATTRVLLTFSQMLDPLTVHALPVLIDIGHEERLEMPLHCPPDRLDPYPFGDRGRLDISQFL